MFCHPLINIGSKRIFCYSADKYLATISATVAKGISPNGILPDVTVAGALIQRGLSFVPPVDTPVEHWCPITLAPPVRPLEVNQAENKKGRHSPTVGTTLGNPRNTLAHNF